MRRRSFLGALASIPVVGLAFRAAAAKPERGIAGASMVTQQDVVDLQVWIKNHAGVPYDLTGHDVFAYDHAQNALRCDVVPPAHEGMVSVGVPRSAESIQIGFQERDGLWSGELVLASPISLVTRDWTPEGVREEWR